MTPEQERAVVSFVEAGGGFLNLHNSMGLYPEHGAYLELIGGRYASHGPLERFRVEVADPDHPVMRGVSAFFVADEQHTPSYDEGRVQLLLRSRSDNGNQGGRWLGARAGQRPALPPGQRAYARGAAASDVSKAHVQRGSLVPAVIA